MLPADTIKDNLPCLAREPEDMGHGAGDGQTSRPTIVVYTAMQILHTGKTSCLRKKHDSYGFGQWRAAVHGDGGQKEERGTKGKQENKKQETRVCSLEASVHLMELP